MTYNSVLTLEDDSDVIRFIERCRLLYLLVEEYVETQDEGVLAEAKRLIRESFPELELAKPPKDRTDAEIDVSLPTAYYLAEILKAIRILLGVLNNHKIERSVDYIRSTLTWMVKRSPNVFLEYRLQTLTDTTFEGMTSVGIIEEVSVEGGGKAYKLTTQGMAEALMSLRYDLQARSDWRKLNESYGRSRNDGLPPYEAPKLQ